MIGQKKQYKINNEKQRVQILEDLDLLVYKSIKHLIETYDSINKEFIYLALKYF